MKTKAITTVLTIVVLASMFSVVTPALAQPGKGPKYPKHVASLLDGDGIRCGQVIFNTNPEDDGTYELEVEVEECLALADSTVDVKLNGVKIGEIYMDSSGNGKATFYVDSIDSIDDVVTVEGAITLTSGVWRPWVKSPGKK